MREIRKCLVLLLSLAVLQCAPSVRPGGGHSPSIRPGSTQAVLTLPACSDDLLAVLDSAGLQHVPDRTYGIRAPKLVVATTAPVLRDGDQVLRILAREYPSDLKDNGIGGRTTHRVLLDAEGRVTNAVLVQASDNASLDQAARTVVAAITFYPATYDDCRAPSLFEVPLVFTPR
jgi:TonB family protein